MQNQNQDTIIKQLKISLLQKDTIKRRYIKDNKKWKRGRINKFKRNNFNKVTKQYKINRRNNKIILKVSLKNKKEDRRNKVKRNPIHLKQNLLCFLIQIILNNILHGAFSQYLIITQLDKIILSNLEDHIQIICLQNKILVVINLINN